MSCLRILCVASTSVFIKTLTGKTITSKFPRTQTIAKLKAELQSSEGIPQEAVLLCAGKQLEANHTLAEYNITEGATLHCVLRLGGGKQLSLCTYVCTL